MFKPSVTLGLIVTTALEILTCPLVTSMVSTVVLSLVFLMTIFPVPFATSSFNVMTRFVFAAIPIALSAGLRELRVGAISSATVIVNAFSKFASPSFTFTLILYVPALSVLESLALNVVVLMLKLALFVSPLPATRL